MIKNKRSLGYTVVLLAVVALCFVVTGCTGSVSGQVFIDENGNGIHDGQEMGVPYAKVTVTRDDKTIAERYTDSSGFFDISIKRVPGRLCVLTDLSFAQANLNYIQQQFDESAGLAAMTVAPMKVKAATTTEEEEEEEEPAEEEVTAETTETSTEPQGWVGDKYCKDVKAKGFEVLIPVNMDYEEAISAMPKRLTITCYAGAECEIIIPYPDGCQLETIYLPEGLSLASSGQGISYNPSLNSISFAEDAGSAAPSAQKAATTGKPAISVGDYRIVFVKLEVASDVPLGTTEYTITPTAKCADQTLELQDIPLKIEREIDVAVYQDLITSGQLMSAQDNVKLKVKVENRGKSKVTYGDLTITPPDGSVFKSLPSYCLDNVKKTICRLEIDGSDTESVTITFKLPELDASIQPGEKVEFTSDAKFFAPGMETSIEAETMKMDIEQQ